jgi:hypothetical protein
MSSPKDLFGQELAVGDTVAFMRPSYRSLCLATILKITPKTILVEYTVHYSDHKQEFRSAANQLIKKPQVP